MIFNRCFSFWREPRNIRWCKFSKENNCQIGAITSYPKSTLSKLVDVMICSSSLETRFRSDALTSRIIQMQIVDFLYVTMTIRYKDFTLDNIYKSRIAVSTNKT